MVSRTAHGVRCGAARAAACVSSSRRGAFTRACGFPDGASSLDAANELIERFDVVAIPGIAFGESMEGWLR